GRGNGHPFRHLHQWRNLYPAHGCRQIRGSGMTPALDLARRHFTRSFGPVTLIATWGVAARDQRWRRRLVLIGAGEELAAGPAYLMPAADAVLFVPQAAREVPGAPGRAARMCDSICERLRLGTYPRDIVHVHMLINEH